MSVLTDSTLGEKLFSEANLMGTFPLIFSILNKENSSEITQAACKLLETILVNPRYQASFVAFADSTWTNTKSLPFLKINSKVRIYIFYYTDAEITRCTNTSIRAC